MKKDTFNFKNIYKTTLLVGSALLLAACGTADDTKDSSDSTTGDSTEKAELTIATWANEQEAKELEEILEDLNSKSDTYVIDHMMIPQDYYTKVQTMVAGNTAPDLIWLAQEYIPAYADNGAIISLTEMLEEQDTIDMDDYFDGALETAMWEGEVVGLPWIGQPYVVYYNKDMMEEKGIDEPAMDWTWDDFIETAHTLTDDEAYGFANTGSLPSAVLAWGYGGDTVTKDGEVLLDTPESIAGFEKLYEMTSDETMTMPFTEAESLGVEPGFVNGDIGMFIGGANDDVEKKVEENGDFEVGMAMMPAGPEKQVTFNWTASTAITDQAENKEAAFEALIDLTEATFNWKVPAPVESKAENIKEVNPYKEYAYDTIRKSMDIARGFNNLPEQNELGAKQWEFLDLPIISDNNGQGNLNVEEAIENTQTEFVNILK